MATTTNSAIHHYENRDAYKNAKDIAYGTKSTEVVMLSRTYDDLGKKLLVLMPQNNNMKECVVDNPGTIRRLRVYAFYAFDTLVIKGATLVQDVTIRAPCKHIRLVDCKWSLPETTVAHHSTAKVTIENTKPCEPFAVSLKCIDWTTLKKTGCACAQSNPSFFENAPRAMDSLLSSHFLRF